jgi:hypothetical protein
MTSGKMGDLIKRDDEEIARSLSVSELVTSFLAAQDIKEISRATYQNGLERFLSWLSSNRITQPNRESVPRFKASLIESGLSTNMVRSRRFRNIYIT